MVTANRQPSLDLKDHLLLEGRQFEFFQAMRLLQRFSGRTPQVRPDVSQGFPGGDIAAIEEAPDQKGYRVTATFFGLYGVSSPLPSFYTREIAGDDSGVTRDFLDILHQRFFTLLIESWEKYRLFHQIEEREAAAALPMLLALCGLPEFGSPAADLGAIRYAGLLGARPRSALGLGALLSDYLEGTPVDIVSFVPRAVRLTREQRLRLGASLNHLGQDSVLGEEISDCLGKFRVRIGPLDRTRFRSLVRGGAGHAALVGQIDRYLTDPLGYDLELILAGRDIRPACLGAAEWSRLGLDIRLFAGRFNEDLHVVFPPDTEEGRQAA